MNPLSPNFVTYNGIILSVQMWRDSPMFTRVTSGGSMFCAVGTAILLVSLYSF